jgi:phenylalanyl-tRNA synthetase beta chain
MNFSLNYLKKMANLIPTTTQESVVDALNNLGFEVEGAAPFVEGNKLVIGTIKSINAHPNADRLKILNVDVGLKDIQIVTGATNIEINKQVIVCLPGSSCNGVEYKTVKLRGIESNGMLASLNELGIADKYLPAS